STTYSSSGRCKTRSRWLAGRSKRGVTGSNLNPRAEPNAPYRPKCGASPANAPMTSRAPQDTLGRPLRPSAAPTPARPRAPAPHRAGVRADRAGAGQRGAEHGQQHLAAGVERAGRDHAPARDELRAGVHVGQVPAAVAARVLHAGAEHAAAPLVRLRADAVDVVDAQRFF